MRQKRRKTSYELMFMGVVEGENNDKMAENLSMTNSVTLYKLSCNMGII